MKLPILETALFVLLTILLVNLIFRRIHIPVILGYLLVGAAVGPHVTGFVPDTPAIKYLAEFGVVFLMFTIGLEFSLSKLKTLRYSVFVLGGLQMMTTIGVTVVAGLFLKMTLVQSLVVGCVLAMSSTALVIRQLIAQNEVKTQHGLNAVGVLLFQDLAVIPVLIVIASLGQLDKQDMFLELLFAFSRGVIATLLILAGGRWVLRPLFHRISATGAEDLFTLTVLFVVLGSAWVTETLGMTYSLGAFLSGIMLAETEFQQKIKHEIRPFKDVLLGLFFVSVGMLANVNTWLETWTWIGLALITMMVGKTAIIVALSRFSKYTLKTSVATALILAQGGEFGFAVLALALANDLLPVEYGQVILAALFISFGLAPLIIRSHERMTSWLFGSNGI